MKKRFLGGLAALTLALAACGGPSTPAPGTDTAPQPAPGSVADVPEGSTAAREYVFSKRQTRQLAQALHLQPLDTVDLGDRLRVVLTVSRAKSGANIGKKKASVTFIWGNGAVNLAGTYTLGLGEFGTSGALKATDGKLALAVKSPDYQAKAGRSTAYVPDTGPLCARLTFTLGAGTATWSSNTPLEVCEGPTERAAKQRALETFSGGLLYRSQSDGGSPWTFARLSDQPADRLPTGAEVLAARGLPAYTAVKTESLSQFFAGMTSNAPGVDAKTVKRQDALYRQFGIYYQEAKVYRIHLSDTRELIYILGRSSSGVSGLWTYRFHAPDGQGDPGYAAAKTYPYLGRYGGSLVGEVQIGPHAAGATVTGRYAVRQSSTCSAGVVLDRNLIQTLTFDPEPDGLTSTQFEIEATPDPETDVVMDYAVTVAYGGQSKTYTGFICDITPPPPPPPSVNDVQLFPSFQRSPNMTTEDGRHEAANLWLMGFDGPKPEWGLAGTQTAGGTYRIEDAPECGAEGAALLTSGALTFSAHNYGRMYSYSLDVPGDELANIGPFSRFVYRVTITGAGGPRVIEGAECVTWED